MWRPNVLIALLLSGCPAERPPKEARPPQVVTIARAGGEPTHETCRLSDEPECRRLCDAGHGESCTRLGRLLLNRIPADDNPAAITATEIERLFRFGCDHGSPRGCNGLGVLAQRNWNGNGGAAAALVWYRRACDRGYPGGCYNEAQLHRFGDGLERDLPRAAALYQRACDDGDPDGCATLGEMHLDGSGVDRDPQQGARLLERACKGNVGRACHNLAIRMMRDGKPSDSVDVARLLRRACKLGSEVSCSPLPTGPVEATP